SAEVDPIQDVQAMLEFGVKSEQQAVKDYNLWANECAQNADSASKKVFEDLVTDEERHFDQFDTELENIAKFGERYLALQSIERSKTRAAGAPAE
ncbi:MAG TPA: ferritin-like domain-containing protein, partial [bacterium]|nr:ferritin-like domain-containing protein [bacterium]